MAINSNEHRETDTKVAINFQAVLPYYTSNAYVALSLCKFLEFPILSNNVELFESISQLILTKFK